MGMNIGQAARRHRSVGKDDPALREHRAPARVHPTDAGYRQYGERDVNMLRFIRHAAIWGSRWIRSASCWIGGRTGADRAATSGTGRGSH